MLLKKFFVFFNGIVNFGLTQNKKESCLEFYFIQYSSSCDLSAKPVPKVTLRYIHSITSPVPVLSKTDRHGVGASTLPAP